ncbi:hypothetical protein [Rathayibacter toxicus]|uniref:Uncharacterized protein n=1 Tax=Rathayibacter toxicus TaxID=145458 RepID=A0A2S5Y9F9_9MICO|nr:hypothetical protein [Rathayibacter toxicus]PPH25108.1 hypothetical protein C5D17_03890 [Rathayibacter toxicus]PPH59035.1 hypothetical protein C5D30_03905 [Rathayibacter toxicus]PPH61028.1 hypothetical protein C5C93_03940 [Rathayibacter toxicus]PPH88849.1 hypothetical protein C5D31_03910 [Rathayibacter toxicus]PPI16539.1 hypothetical protein C5C51_03900 [Rathayibacter toxicus]
MRLLGDTADAEPIPDAELELIRLLAHDAGHRIVSRQFWVALWPPVIIVTSFASAVMAVMITTSLSLIAPATDFRWIIS